MTFYAVVAITMSPSALVLSLTALASTQVREC